MVTISLVKLYWTTLLEKCDYFMSFKCDFTINLFQFQLLVNNKIHIHYLPSKIPTSCKKPPNCGIYWVLLNQPIGKPSETSTHNLLNSSSFFSSSPSEHPNTIHSSGKFGGGTKNIKRFIYTHKVLYSFFSFHSSVIL